MGEANGIRMIFTCKLGKATNGECELIAASSAPRPETTVEDEHWGCICFYILLQDILSSPIFHPYRDLDGSGGDIVGVYERDGCI